MPAPIVAESQTIRGATALWPLALVRIAIGMLFLARTTAVAPFIFGAVGMDARPLLGWPTTEAIGLGLALPAASLEVLCVVRTVGLVAFTLGFWVRYGSLIAVGSGYLVLYQTPFAFTSTQHLLLQATLLLGLADTSAVWALRRDAARSPGSSIWMVRAFVASVYVWAGAAKLRHDWLDGRTLALFHEEGRLRGPLADWLLSTPARTTVVAPTIAFGELALAPVLLYRRTRGIGLIVAASFHLGIEWMGHPDVIGWTMLCLLIIFVGPDRKKEAASANADG